VNSIPLKYRNRFDIVTAGGLINNNYMDETLFEQMLIVLKFGGFIVLAARFSYLGEYWYGPIIKNLIENGRIKAVAEEEFFKYDKFEPSIGRFQRSPVKVMVFQKTEENSMLST
jgi:hypothetical protein